MPSVSKKQHNFMEAIAHSPSFAKKVGVPQKVGQDFANADKGRKFSKGGDMATKMSKFEKSGKDVEKRGVKEGSAKDMAMDRMQMMGMKKGGGVKKMAGGGSASARADGIASRGKTKGTIVKMNKGGMSC